MYDLLKIKQNKSDDFIAKLNEIAGQNIFMKAKDIIGKNNEKEHN